jgi:hypothetical protein
LENVNASIKAYLQQVVTYNQDNWMDHLPLSKFTVNNYILTTTGLTLFFANKGYHPQFNIEPLEPIDKKLLYGKHLKMLLANQHTDHIKDLLDYCKGEIA